VPILAAVCGPIGRVGAEDNGAASAPLLSTGTTALGGTLHYPMSGPAHITAAIVTLAPGASTALHRHGVPMFAYILDGEITVDYGDRGKPTYRQGDALMEAMDVPHCADAGSSPVRILVVFIGAEGAPMDVIPSQP
jgi:quercetin dioxygenase-like cupin family protein